MDVDIRKQRNAECRREEDKRTDKNRRKWDVANAVVTAVRLSFPAAVPVYNA
jgi:hypothetical protein